MSPRTFWQEGVVSPGSGCSPNGPVQGVYPVPHAASSGGTGPVVESPAVSSAELPGTPTSAGGES